MFASKDIFLKSSGGNYQISRSVRLRSSATAYLNRTPATAGDRKTWTYSCWVKRGKLGADQGLISAYTGTATINTQCSFMADDTLDFYDNNGSYVFRLTTTQVFRDPSAWYHIVLAVDTTQATSSNRVKIYVNGTQITSFSTATYPPLNDATGDWNSNTEQRIGRHATLYFDGYLAEINNIDGQALTPSSFGETNSVTGVWQPKKYAGTYGTNGFYLNFSDNSGATATTIGKDYSGNSNNWTPNNISVTAGVTYDSMLDVPTLYADGGNGRGNYCVLNPLDKNTNIALSEGNLTAIPSSTADYWLARATMAFPTTGKWYWELTLNNTPYLYQAGIYSSNRPNSGSISATGNEYQVAWGTAYTYIQFQSNNAAFAAWGTNTNPTSGNVLMFAYDADNATMWIGRNGTWYNTSGTANPATNTDPRFSSIPSGLFAGVNLPNPASGGVSMNFGQRPFTYTPPTGFVALNTQNLPTPTISNGASYFNTVLYTGNAVQDRAITGFGFDLDLAWIKSRNNAGSHVLVNSVVGGDKQLFSNLTNAEQTNSDMTNGFTTGGILVGDNVTGTGSTNQNTYTYALWGWNAGGSTVTNTSGSISSQVRANATAGFSVVTYTGTGANATVGHGLGVALNFIIIKDRTSGSNFWVVGGTSIGFTSDNYLRLNGTGAIEVGGGVAWNSTAPTSTVFSIGTSGVLNASSNTYVAYCFAAVAGYSAFGSYTGNGSADGPFVYLGFRPRWLMIKRSSTASVTYGWQMYDTSRQPANTASSDPNLWADTSAAEGTGNYTFDLLSNGFKLRSSGVNENASGNTYIYMAFAENPFKLSLAR